MFASLPDLLRLVAVPFFGYVAYRDVETRRVPNRTWYPLAALAVVLLVWEGYALFSGTTPAFRRRRFLLGVALSVALVVPLVYGFWLMGGFGGADAKAFFVIAVLFPLFPSYHLWELGIGLDVRLPLVRPQLPVFSLTILTNTVVAGLVYPVGLAVRNALRGRVSPAMFVGKPVPAGALDEEYGTLLTVPDRSPTADLSPAGLRAYLSWRGLDLDALRMYLRWRDCSLAELRADPELYRDPASVPAEPSDPGDGAIPDGGRGAVGDDPWGAERFLEEIEGSAYGTTPATLREGLETAVAEETVWISPGIPFLVPLFAGLVASLTVGDVLFAVLGLAGLV